MNIFEYSKAQPQRIDELVQMVNDGLLTADEAAQSLAGWETKNNPSWAAVSQETDENVQQMLMEDLMKRCRMNIESRLPDWQGMKIGRHI